MHQDWDLRGWKIRDIACRVCVEKVFHGCSRWFHKTATQSRVEFVQAMSHWIMSYHVISSHIPTVSGGNTTLAKPICPCNTRVNATVSNLEGVPKWMVRVISVVPSRSNVYEYVMCETHVYEYVMCKTHVHIWGQESCRYV